MSDLSDAEWDMQAGKMADEILEIIDGHESDMIIEVLACIVADMLDPFEPKDGIPLALEFLSEILRKSYGVEASVMTRQMQ